MSYKKQELLTLRKHPSSPRYYDGVHVDHRFSFLLCAMTCLYVEFRVETYVTISHKTMFSSSLSLVVGRRVHVLFTLFVFVCVYCVALFFALCTIYCQFLLNVHF